MERRVELFIDKKNEPFKILLPTLEYEELLDVTDYLIENNVQITPLEFTFNEKLYSYDLLEKIEDIYLLNDLLISFNEFDVKSLNFMFDERKNVFNIILNYIENPNFENRNEMIIKTMNHYFESPEHFNSLIEHYKENVLNTYEKQYKDSSVRESSTLYKVTPSPFSYGMIAKTFSEIEVATICDKIESFREDLVKTDFFVENPTYAYEMIRHTTDHEIKCYLTDAILDGFKMDLEDIFVAFKLESICPVDLMKMNCKYPHLKEEIREIQYNQISINVNGEENPKESILDKILSNIKDNLDKYCSMIPNVNSSKDIGEYCYTV